MRFSTVSFAEVFPRPNFLKDTPEMASQPSGALVRLATETKFGPPELREQPRNRKPRLAPYLAPPIH